MDLSLPVTVATGFLGNASHFIWRSLLFSFINAEKLTLTIPWTSLYTDPTKVSIDGLYMLIVPKNGKEDEHRLCFWSMLSVEVPRDLAEYHAEKLRRVQRKVDNLRRAASSEWQTLDGIVLIHISLVYR